MSPSVREIIELNIEYYRRKLRTETDSPRRQMIAKLLREEEIKLVRLAQSVSTHKALPSRPNLSSETD